MEVVKNSGASSAPEGAVSINGELTTPAEAAVSVLDRGFLYGDSAFEVMRTYGGKPFRERQHLERLLRSCEGLHIRFPFSLDDLSDEVQRTIQRSGLDECYVRVVVTRGGGPIALDLSLARNPLRVIYALPLRTLPPAYYEHGIAVGLVSDVGLAAGGAATRGIKSSNYLNSVLALHAVAGRGCQEAIVVGRHGEIMEGSSSNVFLVRGKSLVTPRPGIGILAGITRAAVMDIATDLGIRVSETLLYPSDLYRCQEAFITSSLREIVPVVRADGVGIGSGRPGAITQRLLRVYRERARADS